MGLAVYECWRRFVIEVNGCQVTMRTDSSQVVGPGRLPCRFFAIRGNLTGELGLEAQMWADVDGRGLLSYYSSNPQAVAALLYDGPHQLVRDLWAFLRDFTTDLRFDDDSWIDNEPTHKHYGEDGGRGGGVLGASLDDVPQMDEQQPLGAEDNRAKEHEEGGRQQQRLLVSEDADEVDEDEEEEEGRHWLGAEKRRTRHGPMRVYRTSASRVVLKIPSGCKYRYTVNANSHVFEPAARHHAHLQWRTIGLTVAILSVVLAIVGLGACTYFSHRHAEYVASYWEYQAIKDQLGSELPPQTYQRLFGEPPKAAVEAAEAAIAAHRSGSRKTLAAAAAAAAAVGTSGAAGVGAAAGAAATGAAVAVLSPAVQQHTAAALSAEAGEAPVIGAGEPDGISSRSSSAAGSEIAVVADAVIAEVAAAAGAEDVGTPPVLTPSNK